MFDPTIRFDSLREQVLDSIANGAALEDIARRWEGLAGMSALPAALMDAGLRYLAVNTSYARLFNLPRSAFISSEHRQVHATTLQALRRTMAANLGLAPPVHLDQDAQSDGGLAPQNWVVTPLKSAQGRILGLLVEYFPEELGGVGAPAGA